MSEEILYETLWCSLCDTAWEHHEYEAPTWCYGDGTVSWARLRKVVLERDGWACRYCGEFGDHADHVVPRARGGRDAPWNLVAACQACNLRKHARWAHWIADWERARSDYEAARETAYLLGLEAA